MGLFSSTGGWIEDDELKPSINEHEELRLYRVKKYYAHTRTVLYDISTLYKMQSQYEYLLNEKYIPYLHG